MGVIVTPNRGGRRLGIACRAVESGASFNPGVLGSALAFWIDASRTSSITKDGSNKVSQWNDLSGNARHLIQATAGKQPTYTVNSFGGLAGVKSDGVANNMSVSFTLTQPTHIFLIQKFTNASSGNEDVFDGTSANSMRSYRGFAAEQLHIVGNAGAADLSGLIPSGGQAAHLYEYQYNGASSKLLCDGTQLTSGNIPTSAAGGVNIFTFGDGASSPGAQTFGEMIVCTSIIAGNTLARLQRYLRTKWGTP